MQGGENHRLQIRVEVLPSHSTFLLLRKIDAEKFPTIEQEGNIILFLPKQMIERKLRNYTIMNIFSGTKPLSQNFTSKLIKNMSLEE